MQSTSNIDSDNALIINKAKNLIEGKSDIIEQSRSLFYFARDQIRYNPYSSLYPLEASETMSRGYGYCVQKPALLAVLARTVGIPARLGFINIRNHRLDADWIKIFATDVVVFHGFTELLIDGKWLKATPAFDLRMCEENGFIPVEFDGLHHAMLHSHDQNGDSHIEYLDPIGSYEDISVDNIIDAVTRAYGPKFLECWKIGVWDYFLKQ